MSYKLVDRVFDIQGISQPERLVLLSLARHANDRDRLAWPAVATLMDQTSLSRASVKRALGALLRARFVAMVTHNRGGRGLSATYRLEPECWPGKGAHSEPVSRKKGATAEPVSERKPAPSETVSRKKGAHSEHKQAQPEQKGAHCEPKGAQAEPRICNEPIREPIKEPITHTSPSAPDVCELLVAVWNRFCGPLPKSTGLDNQTRRSIRARLKEDSRFLEKFEAAIRKAAQTPFLRGDGPNGWTCDFNWMLKSGRARRVLEGSYDGTAMSKEARRRLRSLIAVGFLDEDGNPTDDGRRAGMTGAFGLKDNGNVIDVTPEPPAPAQTGEASEK